MAFSDHTHIRISQLQKSTKVVLSVTCIHYLSVEVSRILEEFSENGTCRGVSIIIRGPTKYDV